VHIARGFDDEPFEMKFLSLEKSAALIVKPFRIAITPSRLIRGERKLVIVLARK
jgi:hypothetical protein